ncbi:hypothetical protein ACFPOE_16120 [Caenimonas terrae]|uniref:Uncharacterized protein n=1 Tax=Caenimonas terrae TaxID=696074 RepID=A0ABW0NGF3_9BURK
MNGLQAHLPANPRRTPSDRLTVFSWGLMFIWIGAAFLADVGWPAGVFGAGVIAVGVQAARVYLGLRVEVFGLAIGIAMLVWGGWHVLGERFGLERIPGGLMPLVFIALGVTLVVRALFRSDRSREET